MRLGRANRKIGLTRLVAVCLLVSACGQSTPPPTSAPEGTRLTPSANPSASGATGPTSTLSSAVPATPSAEASSAPAASHAIATPIASTSTQPTASTAPDLSALQEFFPASRLSEAAKPLELAPTPADAASVSAEIGADGGEIVATGPDGTVYTLDIPADAVLLPTNITVTPLADVAGFPFDAQPEHRVGVDLAPSGLHFAKSATLRIHPPTELPLAGVATLDYKAGGHDAGVNLSTQQSGELVIPIDHFSGYVATWPIKEAEWRALARTVQEEQERIFEGEIAILLAFRRGMILAGRDPDTLFTDRDVAHYALPQYLEIVLNPRLAAATFGCAEGKIAIATWLAYWRQAQLLGVTPDPNDPNDPNAEYAVSVAGHKYFGPFDFPEILLATVVDHCFIEAYQKCVGTGDFFGIFVELYAFERFSSLLGRELEPAWIQLMTDYAKRCGQWQVNVTTNLDAEAPPNACCGIKSEVRRKILIKWQPNGSGLDGIRDSKIDGSGVPEITSLSWHGGPCTVSNKTPTVVAPAVVKLERMEFKYDADAQRNLTKARPVSLAIAIGPQAPGSMSVTYTAKCHGVVSPAFPTPFDEGQLITVLLPTGRVIPVTAASDSEKYAFTVNAGWRFSGVPFQALTVRSATVPNGTGKNTFARIEVLVMHKPQ